VFTFKAAARDGGRTATMVRFRWRHGTLDHSEVICITSDIAAAVSAT
jgi:hypothetical protein